METRLTLRPGQNGTRKLSERFGKRLVRVIVAESAWTPRSRKLRSTRSPDDMVYIRVGFGEQGLRAKLKALGALWRPQMPASRIGYLHPQVYPFPDRGVRSTTSGHQGGQAARGCMEFKRLA